MAAAAFCVWGCSNSSTSSAESSVEGPAPQIVLPCKLVLAAAARESNKRQASSGQSFVLAAVKQATVPPAGTVNAFCSVRQLTALVRNTPVRLQTSPTLQIKIMPRDRPSELPFMKLVMIWGKQHMPMQNTETSPNTKDDRSFWRHMQSPNDFAQSAQPGSQETPMFLC